MSETSIYRKRKSMALKSFSTVFSAIRVQTADISTERKDMRAKAHITAPSLLILSGINSGIIPMTTNAGGGLIFFPKSAKKTTAISAISQAKTAFSENGSAWAQAAGDSTLLTNCPISF